MAGDEPEVGEGLDILDERGPTVHAALEGPISVDGGCSVIAGPVGKRALLARDVAGRGRDELNSDQIGSAFGDRPFEVIYRRGATVHGEIGIGRADGRRRCLNAIKDEVRNVCEEDSVLAARRLALHCIGDDDGPTPGGPLSPTCGAVDDRLHLAGRREPSTATTT